MCGLNALVCNNIVVVNPEFLNGEHGHHSFVYGMSDVFPAAAAIEVVRQGIMSLEDYRQAARRTRGTEMRDYVRVYRGKDDGRRKRLPPGLSAYALGETAHAPAKDSWLDDEQWRDVLTAATRNRIQVAVNLVVQKGILTVWTISAWDDAAVVMNSEEFVRKLSSHAFPKHGAGSSTNNLNATFRLLFEGNEIPHSPITGHTRRVIKAALEKRLLRFVRLALKLPTPKTMQKAEYGVLCASVPDLVHAVMAIHEEWKATTQGRGSKRRAKRRVAHDTHLQKVLCQLETRVPAVAEVFLESRLRLKEPEALAA